MDLVMYSIIIICAAIAILFSKKPSVAWTWLVCGAILQGGNIYMIQTEINDMYIKSWADAYTSGAYVAVTESVPIEEFNNMFMKEWIMFAAIFVVAAVVLVLLRPKKKESVAEQSAPEVVSDTPMPSMLWHKFLIYFGLIIVAILFALSAIITVYQMVLLSQIEYAKGFMYVAPVINTVGSLAGIALFLVARHQLSKFKSGAPEMLTTALVVPFVTYSLALLCTSMFKKILSIGTGMFYYSGEVTFYGWCILLAIEIMIVSLNSKYFVKRSKLFRNK